MNESTKRALRTGYHTLIAVITAIPTIVPLLIKGTQGLPYADRVAAAGAAAVAWAASIAMLINKLEDAHIIPAPLRNVDGPADPPTGEAHPEQAGGDYFVVGPHA